MAEDKNKKGTDWSFSVDESKIEDGGVKNNKHAPGAPPKNHKTIGHSSAKKSSREITLDFEKVPVRRLRRDYLDNIEDDPSSPPSPPKKIPKKNKDGHHVSLAEKVETFIVDNILLVGMAIALAMALLASKVIL